MTDGCATALEHQDHSGAAGAPLAVFNAYGGFVGNVPADDLGGERTLRALVVGVGAASQNYEILTTCINHPTVAAVDCTDCVPLDEPRS